MAIQKSPFSGWRLSGEDAEVFMKHFNDPTPNLMAIAAANRGQKLVEEYLKNGFVVIKPIQTGESQYKD